MATDQIMDPMHRNIDKLSDGRYDVVVVGGGVLGAFVAWEAIEAGLEAALLEREDFGSGTTSASGKVLHGGLRYMASGRPSLAYRAQRDQAFIRALAPRLVRPLPFLVPAESNGFIEQMKLRAGALTWRGFTRFGPDDQPVPSARFLGSVTETARKIGHESEGTGALLFHDRQLRSPERLTLAVVDAACRRGAAAANHLEVVGLRSAKGVMSGVLARDRLSGSEVEVRGRYVVNATGVWTPGFLESVDLSPPLMGLAKGIHVVLDRPEPEQALALMLSEKGAGKGASAASRRVFIMPWEGRTLVGASYAPYSGDAGECRPTRTEAEVLLASIDAEWPALDLTSNRIAFAYAGLYPVFGRSRAPKNRYGASLHPLVVDHAATGEQEGLVTAVATKLTTAPTLARQVVSMVVNRLDVKKDGAPPVAEALPLARPTPLDHMDELPSEGSRAEALLPHMVAEAVENEMCQRLSDFVFRRTWLGHLGPPDEALLKMVAGEMAVRLGWDDTRTEEEKRRVRANYSGRAWDHTRV